MSQKMKITRRGLFRFGRDVAVAGAIAPVVAKAAEPEVDWGVEFKEQDVRDIIYNVEPVETPFLSQPFSGSGDLLAKHNAEVFQTWAGNITIFPNRYLK